MSKTESHSTEGHELQLGAVHALAALDLTKLSFTQLRRLHKILRQASDHVADEIKQRTNSDNSGDTVRVPSPEL